MRSSPEGLLAECVVVFLQLTHEARVGLCIGRTAADKADRLGNAPAIVCHQVARNYTGTAAHALHTVHKYATTLAQCVADESACAGEVGGEFVKGGVTNRDLENVRDWAICFWEHDWIWDTLQKRGKAGRRVDIPLPDMTDRTCVIP